MPSILYTAQNLKTLIRIRKIHTKVWDFLYKSLKTLEEMKYYEILHPNISIFALIATKNTLYQ